MKNIHAKLFTFGLLTVVFVVAFLANQMAGATDWHFGGYATATAAPTPAVPSIVAGVGTVLQFSGSTGTILYPAGIADGDVCYGLLTNTSSVTPGSGQADTWISADLTNGFHNFWFWHKYHGGGSEGSGILFAGVQNGALGQMDCVRNTAVWLDNYGYLQNLFLSNGTSTTPPSSASLEPVNANDILLLLIQGYGGVSGVSAVPAGFTSDKTSAGTASFNSGAVGHLTTTSAGWPGSYLGSTSGTSTNGMSISVPLQPHSGAINAHGGSYATPSNTGFAHVTLVSANNGTAQLAWPAGVQEGDLMCGIVVQTSGQPTMLTHGMAMLDVTNGSQNGWFCAIYVTGDPSNVVIGNLGSGDSVCAAAYRGLSLDFDMSVMPSFSTFSASSFTSTGFTSHIDNDLVVQMVGWNTSASNVALSSAPAGFTDDGSVTGSSSTTGCEISHKLLTPAGAIAGQTTTLSASVTGMGVMVGFSPQ